MIHLPTHPLAHVGFDVVAWGGGLVLARALYRWRLRERVDAAARRIGKSYFVALGVGAVIGGYLSGSLVSMVGPAPVISHSIAGVLAGGIVGVELYKLLAGIRVSTGSAFAGPLAFGLMVGRWGCLFAGLADNTYGSPTRLPWAVDLGDGIGRHPVEVYESLAMASFLAVYLWGLARRADWAMRRGFYVFIVWYGLQRFAWEFLKPYPRLAGPFDLFHFVCLGLIAYGWVYFLRDRAAQRAGA